MRTLTRVVGIALTAISASAVVSPAIALTCWKSPVLPYCTCSVFNVCGTPLATCNGAEHSPCD